MPAWCDAHLHLQDPRLSGQLGEIILQARAAGVLACSVNTTCEADWPAVAALARAHPDWIIPSFGIHPWKADTTTPGWDARLIRMLEEFPHAGIGECGVDRWVKSPPIVLQRSVFSRQLALARALDRTVSVHCLKAWGLLLDELAQQTPRRFLIHSFGGSAETARELLRLGAYFSFSGYFLFPKKHAVLEVFRQLPKHRILVETDAPDMAPPDEFISHCLPNGANHPANLPSIGRALAKQLGMEAQTFADITNKHFHMLFPRRHSENL